MGVPKFYRWLSERYPLINHVVEASQKPEFDCLYLDMNGIVHNCTHGENLDPKVTLTEDQMFANIFRYIDKLFSIAQPKKFLFMAIDGVAPRAKMNQQRQRRFRAAQDATEAREKAAAAGEQISDEAFDSNCITPGTEFMAKLSKHLKYFVRKKMEEDTSWQRIIVLLSGSEVAGEGEHKIMQYIRTLRMQPGYNPNLRHCLYGLDADLIMLSLVSHEPHFALLREEVVFGQSQNNGTSRKLRTKMGVFQFLHISVLREYLTLEFDPSDSLAAPFIAANTEPSASPFDLEHVIDDFVVMCFLVGNDFMPHLPSLDIGEGGLDTVMRIYKEHILPNGHLVKGGKELQLAQLEVLFEKLALVEEEVFQARLDDEADYKRRQQKNNRDELDEPPEEKSPETVAASPQGPVTGQEFKARYYKDKFPEFFKGDEAETQRCIRRLCESYLQACHWCLQYYYQGCSAWQWFFPYRYAPLASDMKKLTELNINIPPGTPFKPLQQLMAVLPPHSAKLLPPAWRPLMTDANSPIKDFYPETFQIDMNGKKSSWEGIALIPFIDEGRLLAALGSVEASLSEEELARNTPGKEFVFRYVPGQGDEIESTIPSLFPDFTSNSICLEWHLPPARPFKPTLLPGCVVPFPGYPSIRALPCRGRLAKVGLNVFGRPSTKDTLLLCPAAPDIDDSKAFGHKLVGRRCFVGWPYLNEALVMGAIDGETKIGLSGGEEKNDAEQFRRDAMAVAQHLLTSKGIDVGTIKSLLTVRKFRAMKRMEDGRIKKWFDKSESQVPGQLILTRNKAPDPRYEEKNPVSVEEQFPVGAEIVYLGAKPSGALGVVTGHSGPPEARKLSVRLAGTPPDPHFGREIAKHYQAKYLPTYQVAKKLGIPASTVGKIMGNVPFDGRRDVGLQLKSSKLAASVHEFVIQGSSQNDNDNNVGGGGAPWMYSDKAVQLVTTYMEKFPALFELINKSNEKFYEEKAYRALRAEGDVTTVGDIEEWLASLNDSKGKISKRVFTPVSSQMLHPLAVEVIETASAKFDALLQDAPPSLIDLTDVAPTELYRKDPEVAWSPSKDLPQLGDRVMSLRSDQGVLFGLRGTVIGVHEDTFVDVVFDRRFLGGDTLNGSCSEGLGKSVPASSLLVLVDPRAPPVLEKKTASTPRNQLAQLRITEPPTPMAFPMAQTPMHFNFPNAMPSPSPRSHKGYTATPTNASTPRAPAAGEQQANRGGFDLVALHAALSNPRFNPFDANAPVNLPFLQHDPMGRAASLGRAPSLGGRAPSLGGRTSSGSHPNANQAGPLNHAPALGGHAPALGGHAPALGGHAPSLGGRAPSLGGHVPSLGGHVPSLGGQLPFLAGHTPSLGGRVPSLGNRAPSQGMRASSQHAAPSLGPRLQSQEAIALHMPMMGQFAHRGGRVGNRQPHAHHDGTANKPDLNDQHTSEEVRFHTEHKRLDTLQTPGEYGGFRSYGMPRGARSGGRKDSGDQAAHTEPGRKYSDPTNVDAHGSNQSAEKMRRTQKDVKTSGSVNDATRHTT